MSTLVLGVKGSGCERVVRCFKYGHTILHPTLITHRHLFGSWRNVSVDYLPLLPTIYTDETPPVDRFSVDFFVSNYDQKIWVVRHPLFVISNLLNRLCFLTEGERCLFEDEELALPMPDLAICYYWKMMRAHELICAGSVPIVQYERLVDEPELLGQLFKEEFRSTRQLPTTKVWKAGLAQKLRNDSEIMELCEKYGYLL